MNTVPTCQWCDPNHAPLPETAFTCRNCGFEACAVGEQFRGIMEAKPSTDFHRTSKTHEGRIVDVEPKE